LKPFPYPSRESNTIQQFLQIRPDIKDLFVYDLSLTSGEMLYSCAGGIGGTKEKYLVQMHNFLKHKSSASILRSVFNENFKNGTSRAMYTRLREKFNENIDKFGSLEDCAKLFLLWSFSGFSHRYRTFGYDGGYCPIAVDYDHVQSTSQISRDKNLIFRREDSEKFSEHLINSNVFLYFYLPSTLGVYGPNFKWNKRVINTIVSKICEFNSKGYKVCVSTKNTYRGIGIFRYFNLPSFLETSYVVQFKDLNHSSDIYLLNF
jgi:hypothetical protein